MYVDKYPHVGPAIPAVTSVVSIFRQNPTCELEARFGRYHNDRFIPGVERKTMDHILEMMQRSSFVKGEDEWHEETDVYFMHDNHQYRTRVLYDSNLMHVSSVTTEKKMICNSCDLMHVTPGNHEAYGDMHVRVSLKTETEIRPPPPSVNPFLVRIKQRKRFVTENNEWAFDFSMTWSGKTKSDAEHSQMNDDAVYEIECECIDSTLPTRKTDVYIATSLLLKMYDFIESDGTLIVKH